jgi:hypothetical protein
MSHWMVACYSHSVERTECRRKTNPDAVSSDQFEFESPRPFFLVERTYIHTKQKGHLSCKGFECVVVLQNDLATGREGKVNSRVV